MYITYVNCTVSSQQEHTSKNQIKSWYEMTVDFTNYHVLSTYEYNRSVNTVI